MRKSGILLPVTSLPSKYGIGCFSKSAYDFANWLKQSGQSYWQILPLCPTSYGDSPYQSFSTFAGNPYLISLEQLISEGLLTEEECNEADFGDNEEQIDYKKMFDNRITLLRTAYSRNSKNYDVFYRENSYWLSDYSMYMALKYHFDQKPWNMWPEDIKLRKTDALTHYGKILSEDINFWIFVQNEFYKQWNKLKTHINNNGISVIGDIPIYVSYDSADVWASPELFELDENLNPICVAGCPPDGFSESGQLWGNPLYNWRLHRENDYSWWISRISHSLKLYDVLRIDHFRGFDKYYSIKYGSRDATCGSWRDGPGAELFECVKDKLGKINIIAEDLGFVTESVKKLLRDCNFPGMKVLEFAFDSRDSGETNDYLPHNYPDDCIAYTGTHDNQTISSWFETILPDEAKAVRDYLCDPYVPDNEIHIPLIALLMRSRASVCIIPIQDWLGLKDNARINTPSTLGNNWTWRVKENQLNDILAEKIYNMTKIFGRL